jgi:hypothetical protein
MGAVFRPGGRAIKATKLLHNKGRWTNSREKTTKALLNLGKTGTIVFCYFRGKFSLPSHVVCSVSENMYFQSLIVRSE